MFPTRLATRLLESFTRPDQTVILDPFSGIGSTALAAEAMGKLGIGLDISEDYIEKAENRPGLSPGLFDENSAPENGTRKKGERRFFKSDARELLKHVDLESVDFVVTSPPVLGHSPPKAFRRLQENQELRGLRPGPGQDLRLR